MRPRTMSSDGSTRDGPSMCACNVASLRWRICRDGYQHPGLAARMDRGRMRRVNEAVRGVLGEAIAKDLRDPRVGFVTVTGVKTSADLRHARVYVSILGDQQEREESL